MTTRSQYPLVTFALFTYNQEEYVKEAVRGALDQDYPNLEIIISDDCSTDGTFAVINSAISSYVGPHRIVVRRTTNNKGSLLHVAEVARIASGRLLVKADGDDVSKSDRVSVLVQVWQESGAWALSSNYNRISNDGHVLAHNERASVIDNHNFGRFFFAQDGSVSVVHGCTSAYDTSLFKLLILQSGDYVLAEDGALSVFVNLLGKPIVHVSQGLILYRVSQTSLTNNARQRQLSFPEIDRDERSIERFARSQANRCRFFLRLEEEAGSHVRRLNVEAISKELALQEAKCSWFQLSMRQRVNALINRVINPGWALPRLFGRSIFYCLKWIASRFR